MSKKCSANAETHPVTRYSERRDGEARQDGVTVTVRQKGVEVTPGNEYRSRHLPRFIVSPSLPRLLVTSLINICFHCKNGLLWPGSLWRLTHLCAR